MLTYPYNKYLNHYKFLVSHKQKKKFVQQQFTIYIKI